MNLTQEIDEKDGHIEKALASMAGVTACLYLIPLGSPLWIVLLLTSLLAPRWTMKQVEKMIIYVDENTASYTTVIPEAGSGELNSKRRIRK